MSIRQKFFLVLGLYVFVAAVFGALAYKEMQTITKRLGFLELADDVNLTMLEVRRHEKNFLLFKDSSGLPELWKYIAILKGNIDKSRGEIIKEIGPANFEAMNSTIAEYERWVQKVVDNYLLQNEQVEVIRKTGRDLEKRLSGRSLERFLVLRRHEKNLMLYKDDANYRNFTAEYEKIDSAGEGLAAYRLLVDDLMELYRNESYFINRMRANAREVQSFTVKLSRQERADIKTALNRGATLLLISLAGVIIIGSLITMKLSLSIAAPLKRLEAITKKIAAGDFSETIEVSGGDEIASLGESFNQMERKLKDAMASLEKTIALLQEKQTQLVEAEKLASLGLLVAGVAHEINNPLTTVLTFSNLMLEQLPEDDPNRERVRMMAWETNRVRTIVRQLLSFARETPINPAKMDVNKTVGEIADSLRAQDLFRDIDLELNLDPELPQIEADPSQVGQVISNLITNATHAITKPGRIGVATRPGQDGVEISVSDTGCGIPAENIKRIFEPFFTTRGPNQGSGLGLAVSYGIVKKHKGDIEVKSEVGKGTTFIVRLPIHG